jgi:radical SAM superfamily enzyme YgiQ (UPF0313 family)
MAKRKKKVFLVSPDERAILYNAGDRKPLGVLYLSASLEQNRIENSVFDLNHQSYDSLLEALRRETPDYVGLAIPSSPSYKQMKEIAEDIKSEHPKIKIIAGGPHVSAIPDCLEGLADASIVGYGEEAILKAVNGQKGIIKEEIDTNKYPIPNRNKLNPDLYSMFTRGLRTATIVTSRGCPYACAFCSTHQRRVDYRNPENIEEEIHIIKGQGYPAVYILDENFVVRQNHFMSVTQIMRDNNMKYKMEMRSSDVTKKRAERLKESGCLEVAMGIESGNNTVLSKTKKNTTVEKNRRAIETFNDVGIPVKGFFILGLPGETYETARQTIDFAEEMREKGLETADFYALTPFPGSPIWESPEKFGIKILSRNFDEFLQKGEPVIETTSLRREKIKELLEEARKRWEK